MLNNDVTLQEKVSNFETACKGRKGNMKKQPKNVTAKTAKVKTSIDVSALINDGGLTVSHTAVNARVKGYDLAQTIAYFNNDATIKAIKGVIENKANKSIFGNSYIATAAGILGYLTEENKSLFAGDKGKGSLNNSSHFSYVSKVYGFQFGSVKAENAKTLKALHNSGYTGVELGKTCQVLKAKTIL